MNSRRFSLDGLTGNLDCIFPATIFLKKSLKLIIVILSEPCAFHKLTSFGFSVDLTKSLGNILDRCMTTIKQSLNLGMTYLPIGW